MNFDGNYGGQFYGDDAKAVGGTFGGTGVDPDNSFEVHFIGVYLGDKDE